MVRISSLYGRTVTLISVVFIGSFAVLALAFMSISAHKTRDAINDLEKSILLANGSIRDFVITRDPVHAKRAEHTLTTANESLHERLSEKQYNRFHSELHLYLHDVSNLITAYQERGFYEGDGLEGKMRENLRSVEETLLNRNERRLLSYLLEIRRSEKNYLLRHGSAYQDDVHAEIDAMTAVIAASGLSAATRASIIENLATYQHDFDEVVYVTQKGEWISSEMGIVQEFLEAELSQLIEQEDHRAQIFLWCALGLILCSFVFGIFYAHFMARSIVKPLEKIRNAAKSLANGELDDDLDFSNHGEVGELALAFTELADQVKMRMQAQQELASSKTKLELYANELEDARDALEMKASDLSALVQELEDAKNVAEHTIISKTLFLANMSHEIRTPLNGIIGMTSLLTPEELRPDQYEIVNVIRTSGENLLEIVNDILDYAKIEQGGVDLEKVAFDITECIEDALDMVSKQAADKRIELSYRVSDDLPASLIGDRSRLRQILINLFANAVKFTEEGEIHTRVSLAEMTPEKVEIQIEVEDSGIGIAKSAQEYLFDPFRQADPSTARKFGGTGLGLSIAKHLAELMGGTMWVESEPAMGSTFSFTVRLTRNPENMDDTMVSAFAAGANVLYLGENPQFALSVCAMIEQGGGHVSNVKTLKQAQIVLDRDIRTNLVLINDGDHGICGREMAQALHPRVGDARIVLFRDIGKLAVDPAVSSCIPKPLKRSALRELFLGPVKQTPIYEISQGRKQSQDRTSSKPMSVLIVEDNKMNQKVAIKMLQKLGYAPDLAENGIEAVEKIKKNGYDVVFMDMMMPGMDGLEATRQVRSAPGLVRQPLIIAFTANATTDDRKMCLEAGMDDYVSKPVNSDTLANILDRARREARTRHGARLENPSGPSVA